MRCSRLCFTSTAVRCSAPPQAAEIVSDSIAAIRHGRAAEALPRLNALKAEGTLVEGVDYARALCFLSRGAHKNAMEARQSLLEELRLHPHHVSALRLLDEVNETLRPLLLPPAEVQREHPLFALLCDALLDSTMLSWPRLFHLYEVADALALGEDRGHVVECGTAGGGSAVLMAVVLAEREAVASSQPPHHRRVFALDTFTGMPVPGEKDRLVNADGRGEKSDNALSSWGTGTCRSSTVHVHCLAQAFSVEDHLVVLPGLFEASIPTQLLAQPDVQQDGIALLHLDADWYASTRTALELLVPVMRRDDAGRVGGSPSPRVVQVDDYHYWEGCKRAVDEYLARWPPSTASPAAGSTVSPPCLDDVDGNAVSFTVCRDLPAERS